jgi:hypothetical protein
MLEQKLVCNEVIAETAGARAITIKNTQAMCGRMNYVETREIC